MSGANETYAEFPSDEHFWLVKYIDQFHLPHAGTRSAAVQVLLQKLTATHVAEVSRLSEVDSQAMLGHRGSGGPEFRFIQVLAGSLPAITIGFIFHQQRKVAELPWQRRELSLMAGEYDHLDFRAGDETTKPPGWGNMPHRTLNRYEYVGVTDHQEANVFLSNSRLVVWRRRRGVDTDIYVIPRMTIFKSFYANHAEIAKAFCSNRWEVSLNDVVCMNDVDSGLKTECLTDPLRWHIVLRTLVQDEYAPLLAVYLFDPIVRISVNVPTHSGLSRPLAHEMVLRG